ncbi:ribosomal L7Ae/L30e/S12e/Gadd45 family protein [Alkalibacillus haloalkaliphilus]|uniref:50S ribosomal protein L7/L12 n=1 Tax=Alkalibacillus haloalkaliphilus TaxID=94136 RepID=A0A511W731_9BACI|nr:ribosomal L7Ae/L30e/S12e/Gadd45 family protein [Alkalibacillus haloalkaliphilus]GEN46900.1 50S ribosomal protein L7/L12 [Alkalibacillus haloalkaliphilus]
MSYEKVAQAQKRLRIGAKQVLKSIKNGEVLEVVIAANAERHVTDKIVNLAEQHNVPVTEVDSMIELGQVSGIDVGAATVAITK